MKKEFIFKQQFFFLHSFTAATDTWRLFRHWLVQENLDSFQKAAQFKSWDIRSKQKSMQEYQWSIF